MTRGLFYLNSLDQCISNKGGAWVVFSVICIIKIRVFNANIIDPDQTPHSVASDLCLHCLQMSLLWEAWYKWAYKSSDLHISLIRAFGIYRHILQCPVILQANTQALIKLQGCAS